ncbi:hypothetical protein FRC10_002351 [Ceratobasidium sp. 414]|nr:hypothetical protein FRC10_002351 [Ceratobasidium sp. 414]
MAYFLKLGTSASSPQPIPVPKAFPRWKIWLFGLIHDPLIKFARFYTRRAGLPLQYYPGVYALPLGLFIKSHERTTEEEAHGMHLARAAGLPVPRFISYGHRNGMGSILMTRVDGYCVGEIYHEATDDQKARFKLELRSLLATMRSWTPPAELQGTICSVTGGPVWGHRIPPEITGPWGGEEAFIADMTSWMGTRSAKWADREKLVREIPSRSHRVVFTHGDLLHHNILVDEECHILAIIDWATAGWMPEWWEYAVATRMRFTWWSKLMLEIGGEQYEWELSRDLHIAEHHADSLRY